MTLAELRRHPVLGEWVAVLPEVTYTLGINGERCIYCEDVSTQAPLIYELNVPERNHPSSRLRVVPGSPPIFRIEGELRSEAVGMCDRMKAVGAHEILIESEYHDAELYQLSNKQVASLLEVIGKRHADLCNDERFRQIVTFKEHIFAGRPGHTHPVWNIIATPFVPSSVRSRLEGARLYYSHRERCPICDYVNEEKASAIRVVVETDLAMLVCPFASKDPFETWLLPVRHSSWLSRVDADTIETLAYLLRLFVAAAKHIERALGYSITIYSAPCRQAVSRQCKNLEDYFHCYFELKPHLQPGNGWKPPAPLWVNPIPPEDAASRLRSIIDTLKLD